MNKPSSERRRTFAVGLLLVLITAAAYMRIADLGFIPLDDGDYITDNIRVQAGLTWKGVKWAFTSMDAANWHPLTWLSHMLDYQLYGLNPIGHHATNLLFHIVNVLLLFLVLSRMTGSIWRSAFVAALFGVHPLHVESVAWVAERKDVLSTFFWLLTILAYTVYVKHPNVRRYLLVMLPFGLGLMSKPMLVTLPLTLLLLDYWPLGRWKSVVGGRWSVVWEKVPLLAMSAASCVITIIAQKSEKAVSTLYDLSLAIRVDNAAVAYAAYILKMLWPSRLAIYYVHPGDALPAWKIAGAVVLLVCISTLVVVYGRRFRYLVMGWLWYLVTLVPVIGLMQVGAQAMADRYTYVPLIGLFIMIAWGIPDLFGRSDVAPCCRPIAVRSLPLLAGAIIAALAVRTWVQTGYWKDDVSLFEQAIRVGGDCSLVRTTLGLSLVDRGELDKAIANYRIALELNPDDAITHNGLGFALSTKGDMYGALCEYRKSVDLDPKSVRAHYNLALALYYEKQLEESVKEFRRVIDINRELAEAHTGLALVLEKMGKLDESKREYRIAAGLEGGAAHGHFARGVALVKQGKLDEAIKEYRLAIRAKPDFIEAFTNLGVALKNRGRIDEAIEEYRKALSINPRIPRIHNNYAVALAIKGEYAQAWEEVRLSRKFGGKPNPRFLRDLSSMMPEPKK